MEMGFFRKGPREVEGPGGVERPVGVEGPGLGKSSVEVILTSCNLLTEHLWIRCLSTRFNALQTCFVLGHKCPSFVFL